MVYGLATIIFGQLMLFVEYTLPRVFYTLDITKTAKLKQNIKTRAVITQQAVKKKRNLHICSKDYVLRILQALYQSSKLKI